MKMTINRGGWGGGFIYIKKPRLGHGLVTTSHPRSDRHGWKITPHSLTWMQLLIHVLTGMLVNLISVSEKGSVYSVSASDPK